MLSEQTEYNLNTIPYDYLITASESHSYNALVCTTFMPEYGRTNVFKVSPFTQDENSLADTVAQVGGQVLFRKNISMVDLTSKVNEEIGRASCRGRVMRRESGV